jgi:hypothetical protein
MKWKMLHSEMTLGHMGYIPSFLNEDNPACAKEQIHHNYAHGGGWHSLLGFTLDENNTLLFPGDPPLTPLAETYLRDEHILFYDYAFVVIKQKDGLFEVARLD